MRSLCLIASVLLILFLIGCAVPDSEKESDQKDDNSGFDAKGLARSVSDSRQPKDHTPIFPRSPAPAAHLVAYDYTGDSFEVRLLLTTLQGQVAKTEPAIYLIWNSADSFWLEKMVEYYGHTYETVGDGWDLMDRFAAQADGVIVYDPDLPSTANLATTLAGIHNGIVVAPSLLDQVQNDYGLPVLMDLRGQFADRVSMYQWAMQNVWPESNQTILAFSDPTLFTLRDYLVTHNIFCVMLDPHIPDERALLEQILAETPPNIPLLGWAIDELLGVMIFSQAGKFHVASDWARNLSVTSGLPFPTLTQSHAPEYAEAIENKTYIAFGYTDGDNLAYTVDAMYYKWQDAHRGEIPLGWEITFNAVDLAPQAIRYFYETATANDMFIGPACGIGYIYPRLYPDLPAFMELTRPYMEAADMDTLWLINDNLTLADDLVLAYSSVLDLAGLFIDYWATMDKGFYFASDGTPVLRSQYVYLIGPEQIPGVIESKKIEKDYLYPDSPFFLFIGVNGWSTQVSYLKSITDELNPEEYTVLRPDEMFMAMRKAHDEGWEF